MSRFPTIPLGFWVWAARTTTLSILLVAALAVMDHEQHLTSVTLPGDWLMHALLSYAITVSLLAAFPRTRALILAAFPLALGVSLEGMQGIGFWAGDAEIGDLVADLAGIAVALAPLLVGARRAGLSAS